MQIFLDETGLVGKSALENHTKQLEDLLAVMEDAGLQINIANSKRTVDSVEYLGHMVKKEGHTQIMKKVKI